MSPSTSHCVDQHGSERRDNIETFFSVKTRCIYIDSLMRNYIVRNIACFAFAIKGSNRAMDIEWQIMMPVICGDLSDALSYLRFVQKGVFVLLLPK